MGMGFKLCNKNTIPQETRKMPADKWRVGKYLVIICMLILFIKNIFSGGFDILLFGEWLKIKGQWNILNYELSKSR